MSSNPNEHPAEHPDREIQEDVLAVPFIAWLGATGAILIFASVLALEGMYYQTKHSLDRRLFGDAEAFVTPAEAKVAADRDVLHGYHSGIPAPDPRVEGTPEKTYVSIPVELGRQSVLERYGR